MRFLKGRSAPAPGKMQRQWLQAAASLHCSGVRQLSLAQLTCGGASDCMLYRTPPMHVILVTQCFVSGSLWPCVLLLWFAPSCTSIGGAGAAHAEEDSQGAGTHNPAGAGRLALCDVTGHTTNGASNTRSECVGCGSCQLCTRLLLYACVSCRPIHMGSNCHRACRLAGRQLSVATDHPWHLDHSHCVKGKVDVHWQASRWCNARCGLFCLQASKGLAVQPQAARRSPAKMQV